MGCALSLQRRRNACRRPSPNSSKLQDVWAVGSSRSGLKSSKPRGGGPSKTTLPRFRRKSRFVTIDRCQLKNLPRTSVSLAPVAAGALFVRATARGAPRRAGFAEGQRDCNSQGLGIRSLGAANGPEAGHTLFEGRHRGCKLSSLSFKDSKNSTIQKIC